MTNYKQEKSKYWPLLGEANSQVRMVSKAVPQLKAETRIYWENQ